MLSLQYCFHSSICCKDMKYLKIWGEKGVPQQTVTAIMIYPVSTGLLCATLSEMQLSFMLFPNSVTGRVIGIRKFILIL